VGLGEAPHRGSAAELFSFGAQLQAALRGLVLTQVYLPTPFERVLKLAFAQRPGEAPTMQLVYECMARYSNLLLVGPDDTVLCAAHQVGTTSRHAQCMLCWALPGLAGWPNKTVCHYF
jgi:predicted ribosome quality control (RQC) complex YloA/Tae2 family protein